jgi:hypothetical protein
MIYLGYFALGVLAVLVPLAILNVVIFAWLSQTGSQEMSDEWPYVVDGTIFDLDASKDAEKHH